MCPFIYIDVNNFQARLKQLVILCSLLIVVHQVTTINEYFVILFFSVL